MSCEIAQMQCAHVRIATVFRTGVALQNVLSPVEYGIYWQHDWVAIGWVGLSCPNSEDLCVSRGSFKN